MNNDFDRILDECIDRINRGESLSDCLADYPSYAERLKPLLASVNSVKDTYAFTPSDTARRAARDKLYAALDKRRQKALAISFSGLFSRPAVWATAVAVLALIIIGIWVIRPALNQPLLVSSPEGNFAFLISDEPNDIGDFQSLNITISRVSLQPASNSENRVEFKPDIQTVDLTRLQGEASREIWRGNVPPGQYTGIIIEVSDVVGKLTATGKTIEVKLPSNKLHLSKPFDVTADAFTSFTYDITVIATGNNGKYILKPQIDESGAGQEPVEKKPDTNKGKNPKQ
jgi:Domain of unknown function (DUF4382)